MCTPFASRLVHRTALGYLGKSFSLRVVERSAKGDMRLNALDESVGALVAVTTIIGMDAVELEPDVDPSELDALVVCI